MSRELRDLLGHIVDQGDLIRGWAVEVGPGGSSLRAQTRLSFERREDALQAAHVLRDELVRTTSREVRGAVPGTTPQPAREWRGVVEVEMAPL
jgi:hypothetical protein